MTPKKNESPIDTSGDHLEPILETPAPFSTFVYDGFPSYASRIWNSSSDEADLSDVVESEGGEI